MANGEELTEGVVMRFGLRSEEDMFYAEKRKPLVGDFDLGSTEKAIAEREKRATLSVWHESLTTVEQAQVFLKPNRRLPIWLSVRRIHSLEFALHVIRSPHERDLPGKDGHCELGNVWPNDEPTFRSIRSALCDIATCDRENLDSGG